MISDILKKSIVEALDKLSLSAKEVSLEHPTLLEHGDYSSNVALVLAKKEDKNPKELAEEVVQNINKPEEVEKIEVAPNGFINFFLSKEFFKNSIQNILEKGSDYGKNDSLKGEKVIVEYTDPNPFKEFHIGHLMPATIGESISRLVEFSGAETKRANYQGDVGMHVAKAVWGMDKMFTDIAMVNLGGDDDLKEVIESLSKRERRQILFKSYSYGEQKFSKDDEIKKEITKINKKIYEKSDPWINAIYISGRQDSLDYFEDIYKILGTKFDYYFFESEVAEYGKKIVLDNLSSSTNINDAIFRESDGAVVFDGEAISKELHTRVFINSKGLPTYEAKELGLAKMKYENCPVRENSWDKAVNYESFHYDKSVVVTANEINEYFKVLIQVMKLVYEKEKLGEKTEHIGHGLLRLPSGKMSSRTGDVIPATSLINDLVSVVTDKMRDRYSGHGPGEIQNDAEKIAVGAIKYTILKQGIGKDVIFNFEKSISFEGDSGPYLQYSVVRAKSLLEKGKEEGSDASTNDFVKIYGPEKLLYQFDEVVLRATEERAPQVVTNYLIDLASSFNTFYGNEKVVGSADASYKLALSKAVAITIENGLHLLGIEVPDKM